MTSMAGAPKRPSSSTFHPSRANNADRAAARLQKFAAVAHVTKPPSQPAGNRKASQTQLKTISSSSAAAGDITRKHAFCPQAPASQFAASAAGSTPPMTKPKYLPPVIATVAGDASSSRTSITFCGSMGAAGNSSRNRASASTDSAAGPTLRSRISLLYRIARSAASCKTLLVSFIAQSLWSEKNIHNAETCLRQTGAEYAQEKAEERAELSCCDRFPQSSWIYFED